MDERTAIPKHGQISDRAFLLSALAKSGTVLLESSRRDPVNSRHFLFTSPLEVLTTDDPAQLPALLERLAVHRQEGRWAAGYLSYESGYAFDTILPTPGHSPGIPLLWFGIYDRPYDIDPALLDEATALPRAFVKSPEFSISPEQYTDAVRTIRKYIEEGDTYQVNFTDRFEFTYEGDPTALYFSLRSQQHVPFSAMITTDKEHLLSFSPELFFRQDGKHLLVKPMKGTSRRGRTNEEDAALAAWLRQDEKNRSENLMIVDLLRNDIGRICRSGSVTVPSMFDVERYDTVLQMTSTITGELEDGVDIGRIFQALFPCGSVTGAPKIRTMQIIHELERHPRGVYCGAIGYIAPDERAVFSVAIRTVALSGTKGIMGAGSGIVYDSVAEQEYEECRLKGRFLTEARPEFQLLETLLWDGAYPLLQRHLERMQDSAEYFQFNFEAKLIEEVLRTSAEGFPVGIRMRVRLLLNRSGKPTVEAEELRPLSGTTIRIADERTNSADPFLFHKTTHRPLYERWSARARAEGLADYIFLNERGEVTEGSFTSIFIEKNGVLLTPPLNCGVLPGVYRNEILRTLPNAKEQVLFPDDLRNGDAVYLCNAVRGMFKVTLSEE